jgi:hypothetical protein
MRNRLRELITCWHERKVLELLPLSQAKVSFVGGRVLTQSEMSRIDCRRISQEVLGVSRKMLTFRLHATFHARCCLLNPGSCFCGLRHLEIRDLKARAKHSNWNLAPYRLRPLINGRFDCDTSFSFCSRCAFSTSRSNIPRKRDGGA